METSYTKKEQGKHFHILVRQAKAGQTIYYSELAKEIDIPNPRNLNFILGAIGNALIALGKRTKNEIPPIQCVVINKRDQLPGEGIGWFISPKDFSKLNKTQKQKVVTAQLTKIYTYQYWDWVLEQLNLKPVLTNLDDELEEAKNGRGGGESQQHKKFKDFIAKNPTVLGLSAKLAKGKPIAAKSERHQLWSQIAAVIFGRGASLGKLIRRHEGHTGASRHCPWAILLLVVLVLVLV